MSRTVHVNGVSLTYDEAGRGVAFVTLHGGPGMGNRKGDWNTFQPLTDTYRLVSYDQRGNGESDGGEPYSHAQFVADLEALRQALDLGKMILLGGSYGGYIALEYALRHQDNLHALILRDTAANNHYQDTSMQRALESEFPMDKVRLARLFAGHVESNAEFLESYKMIQPLYNVTHDPAKDAERLAQIPFRYKTHNYAFSRNQADFDITEALREVQTPTLVTVGRFDWITPLEASEELAEVLPNSELVVFENSGHSPQLEERERYLSVVRDFLAQHIRA